MRTSWSRPLSLLLSSALYRSVTALSVNAPSNPPSENATIVYANFLGLSVELAYLNFYFGNTTSDAPQPMLNYLSALHDRSSGLPLRVRLGGNSMDSATYVPSQQDMIEFTDPNSNSNDPIVNFGPVTFDVMNSVSDSVGGIQYLIGLSLRDPNSSNIPLLAGDAQKALGNKLDSFILGNEPDLYTRHGDRPNMANYSVYDYIGDYWVVLENLQDTPTDGDVLSLDKISGPTICCVWDLDAVLQSGWLNDFSSRLNYITLQHYPQDVCSGSYSFGLSHYLQHANTVSLAQWQSPGIDYLLSLPPTSRRRLIMDEFNSLSCGGVPGLSNTFGVAMWTADYALQMASVGYSAAYLHTREPGISYNPVMPPAGVADNGGAWSTNPNYYAMLVVAEALQGGNGNRVVDLNIANSMQSTGATAAGYAAYDGNASVVNSIVLFNYANSSGTPSNFSLDSAFFHSAPSAKNVTVRFLTAPSVNEEVFVTWGGQTLANIGDGLLTPASSAAWNDQSLSCASGCTVQVPGPGVAVLFLTDLSTVSNSTDDGATSSGTSSSTGSAPTGQQTTSGSAALPTPVVGILLSFLLTLVYF
ncbi:glycoside hydrolase family 79 protein [Gelatoporia subvermispora B]|uniref:Glycoside hydrolase family 79 protein n=1 Tax=Ceriporiopsis subvermispora (strain B) TaxID=914234 RepID=M2RPQ5_CERS8|nr:glycoside hydrolase family 79 protein [Gelatoporia subvermispora B]